MILSVCICAKMRVRGIQLHFFILCAKMRVRGIQLHLFVSRCSITVIGRPPSFVKMKNSFYNFWHDTDSTTLPNVLILCQAPAVATYNMTLYYEPVNKEKRNNLPRSISSLTNPYIMYNSSDRALFFRISIYTRYLIR